MTAEEYFKKGYDAHYKGDFNGAIEDYTKAIEIDPNDAMAYNNRGNAKHELSDYHGAIEDYTKAIEIDTDFALAYNNRSVAKHELSDYQGAIEDWTKAIEIEPTNTMAYYSRSVSKHKLSDYQGAMEDCNKAIGLDPDFAGAYYSRGLVKIILSDYHGAIEDFDKAIEINPEYAEEAYTNRGIAKSYLKDYHGAIEDFDKAIEINPEYAGAYHNRGATKSTLFEYQEAIEDYTKAIEIEPNAATAYSNRSAEKIGLSDYHGAIEDCNKAIEIEPNNAMAYSNRGYAKHELSDYHGAIEDFDKAIEIEPNDAMAYSNRGATKLYLEDYHGAIEDCSKAIEIDPNNAMAYSNRGAAKIGLSDYHGAIEDCNKAIEIDPNDAMAYSNRGLAYEMLEKTNNDWLTCLYLSIKQKKTKFIYKLLGKLKAYPQNIKYTFEHFNLNMSSFLQFQSACDKLTDFNLLIDYYENNETLKGRELLSAKAILYYYLGGNVQAFSIYAEELDNGTSLSAQELYYYALTAQEINYYSEDFLDYCISQIKNKPNKTSEDYYYLGQLYIIDNDIVSAKKEFENSFEHKERSKYNECSAIMLKEYIDEKDFESFVLSGEIDYKKGISQFDDYFHFRECRDNDIKYEELWKAFSLKNSFNGEINITERKFEAEIIIDNLINKYEKDANDTLNSLSKPEKAKEIFSKIHDEGENAIFKQIKKQIEAKKNPLSQDKLEDKLVFHIIKLKQEPIFYLYYIQYEYLRKNLTPKQAFNLTLFFRSQVYDNVRKKAKIIITKTLLAEYKIDKLIAIANGLYSLLSKEDRFREIIDKADDNKKAYIGFNEDIWKKIRLDYDILCSEKEIRKDVDLVFSDDFINKWGWFGW